MMTNETADRIKGLAASMRATAHAGDVYSGKTLISKSNALRYADDFEALLSALDEAVSGWNEESEKLTDETERANAAEFLLALMAAAAETTYRTGFRDAERVTDERHIDYLRGNTIAGIAAAMQAPDADLTARVETLQARVEELEGALKPFMPISIRMTPDDEEVEFGEHQTQAMTMDPQPWIGLNDAYGALLTPPLEQDR